MRYDFRAALDPAAESETGFLERCRSWMAARLAAPGPWRAWIAEEESKAAGMVWLLAVEKLPNPVAEPERHGYVSSLFVRPEARGHGLGPDLLAVCLKSCEMEGFDAVFLWPTPRSRRLYLRHGFGVQQDLLERRLAPVPAHGGVVPG
jgi:ribosomal protein S18 acetylase RimI-like enzyme